MTYPTSERPVYWILAFPAFGSRLKGYLIGRYPMMNDRRVSGSCLGHNPSIFEKIMRVAPAPIPIGKEGSQEVKGF